MNSLRKTFAIAILALACSAAAVAQAVQGIQQPSSGALGQVSGVPYQIAGFWTFNASSAPTGGFNVVGLKYFQLTFVTSGTVATCAISFDSSTNNGGSFTTGGIVSAGTIGSCAAPSTFANSSAVTPTNTGQLTPTITGTGSVTVVLFGYINNPGAAGSASSSITSPLDGSGFVNIDCKAGCTGGNANGQATMALSAPVVIASNQTALPVNQTIGTAGFDKVTDGTNTAAVKAASTAAIATDPSLVIALSPNTALPAGANTIGAVTQATGSNLHTAVDSLPAVPTGSNTIGNVNQAIGSAGFGKVTDGTNTAAVKAASTAAIATDPSLVIALSPNTALPAGANTIGGVTAAQATAANLNATVVGSGNFNTLPAGFAISPLSGQQAVTASAVALATNATHSVCVQALIANTIPVYVGATGETTATGFPLNAGDMYCWQVSNSNLIFVIATTTGASVAWTAL